MLTLFEETKMRLICSYCGLEFDLQKELDNCPECIIGFLIRVEELGKTDKPYEIEKDLTIHENDEFLEALPYEEPEDDEEPEDKEWPESPLDAAIGSFGIKDEDYAEQGIEMPEHPRCRCFNDSSIIPEERYYAARNADFGRRFGNRWNLELTPNEIADHLFMVGTLGLPDEIDANDKAAVDAYYQKVEAVFTNELTKRE